MRGLLILIGMIILPYPCGLFFDQCDVMEINRMYDTNIEEGMHIKPVPMEPVFEQCIAWDYDPCSAEYKVVDWCNMATLRDVQITHDGRYITRFDTESGIVTVRSDCLRETWCGRNVDPELYDRKVFPKSCRRGISGWQR